MKTYAIYLRDGRRGQTITLSGQFAHDRRAREFARQRLDSCPDYESIEVWDGPIRLCRFRANGEAEAAQAA